MKRSILAHRGHWKEDAEKNTRAALALAPQQGYGIETDVRDSEGRLIVSHDMPVGGEMALLEVVEHCNADQVPIAINIKADGLATPIKEMLDRYPDLDAFCFDMSVPELLQYQKRSVPCFTRVSEFERTPALYDDARGVWLDAFFSDWYSADLVERFLGDGKQVAIVSPELHRRDHRALWETLRDASLGGRDDVFLCTDYPDAALEFFREAS